MTKVNYPQLMQVMKYIHEIDQLNFREIEWTDEKGQKIEIHPKILKQWKFIGLSNSTFADMFIERIIKGETEEIVKEFCFED